MRNLCCRALAVLMLCGVAYAQDAQQEREVTSDLLQNEAELLALLQGEANFVEKQMACRALKKVGTAASVPVLAGLLNDAELSHLARYALESMELPEAGQALREALGKAQGPARTGIVISLGAREDAQAVPLIAPLLSDGDAALTRAAAAALGRIATPDAVEALRQAAGNEALRGDVAEALLATGHLWTERGRGGAAAAVFTQLMEPSWPEYVRLGAFRGIALAQPEQAPSRLLAAMNGDDEVMRGFAAQLVTEISGTFSSDGYIAGLNSLNPAGQAAYLRGLAGRGDAAARQAVVQALGSQDSTVRLAAIQALAPLGTPADVDALAAFLTDADDALARAARASLKGLPGRAVDTAIAQSIEGAGPELQALLIQILSDRMSPETIRVASARLNADAIPVRVAALDALAQQGTGAEAAAVVAALRGAENTQERQAAARALGSIAAHHGEATLPALLQGMDGANPDARLAMVRTLDRVGNTEALNATVALLDDADTRISTEAGRVLSNWPSQEAAPHLLRLAQGESSALKDAGLRGYVRLAREERDLGKRVEMLNAAMAHAATPQEKFIVLAAWGTVPTAQALDTLLPHLEDPAVQNEAASAIIAAAATMGRQGDDAAKAKAREALGAVLGQVQNEGIRERAQGTLDAIPG